MAKLDIGVGKDFPIEEKPCPEDRDCSGHGYRHHFHHHHGSLHEMVLPIIPAVLEAQDKHPADLQDAAIHQNVRDIAGRLKVADGVLSEKLGQGRLKIVSACYDLATGVVSFDA